jgi:HNH endonuclease
MYNGIIIKGRPCVQLQNKITKKGDMFLIHRLVAITFLENNGKTYVNHKDGIKTNNNVENLEYVTQSENVQHAYNTGLTKHYTRSVIRTCKHSGIETKYDSIKEASEETGIPAATIRYRCNINVKRNNELWRYDQLR